MAGWVCLHRDIQSHWLWDFKHADKALAWIDMLMLANHEKKKFLINGVFIECDRGEFAYSQLSLCDRWRWSRNKVRGFLEMLKNDSMIVQRTNQVTTIITICNYSQYQDIKKGDGTTDGTTDGTAKGQRKGHKQQYKQLNNKTNINKPNGLIPYQEIVNLYIENLPELPGVVKITKKRKDLMTKLWNSDPGINDLKSFDEYFKHIKKIKFLNGVNDRGWTPDFEWLVNPINFLKIIEGKYK